MQRVVLQIFVFVLLAVPLSREASAGAADKDAPIIAVFDLDVKNGPDISPALSNSLRDYVEGLLVQSRQYRAVPQGQIQTRLAQEKKKTGNMCYDEKCQIELGRELAAEKSVALQVNRLGSICTVKVSVYDLRTQTTDGVRLKETSCTEDGYVAGFRQAVNELVEEDTPPVAPPVAVAPAAPAPPAPPADSGGRQAGNGKAQAARTAPGKGRLTLGFDGVFSYPFARFADISGMGFGGLLLVGIPLGERTDLTGRFGYIMGLSSGSGSIEHSVNMMPVLAGIRTRVTPIMYVSVEGGIDNFEESISGLSGSFVRAMSRSSINAAAAAGIGFDLGILDLGSQILFPALATDPDLFCLLATLGIRVRM